MIEGDDDEKAEEQELNDIIHQQEASQEINDEQ